MLDLSDLVLFGKNIIMLAPYGCANPMEKFLGVLFHNIFAPIELGGDLKYAPKLKRQGEVFRINSRMGWGYTNFFFV